MAIGYHSQITSTAAPAATAADLDLGYGHAAPALADATFTLPAGAVTALVGPNGAGKSTLLHALAGLLQPQRGRLDVPALGERAGAAFVLQSTQVNEHLPLSVREAVTMGRYATSGPFRRLGRDDRAAVDAAMEAVAIADLASKPLRELSGGQRQRAFVGQGLAQGASLLLLDEPITGLDLVSREHIVAAIDAERAAGRTVVVSTHDLGDAARADNLMLLAGRVIACGTPDEVLTEEALARAYGSRLLRVGGALLLDDPHHDHHLADGHGH